MSIDLIRAHAGRNSCLGGCYCKWLLDLLCTKLGYFQSLCTWSVLATLTAHGQCLPHTGVRMHIKRINVDKTMNRNLSGLLKTSMLDIKVLKHNN